MRKPTATDARPPQDRRCDFHIASPDLSGSPYPSDYEVDARDVVDLLAAGAHLVGHSYGAVVAMLAAATRPDLARSLALIEPPPWTVRCPGCPPRRRDPRRRWRGGEVARWRIWHGGAPSVESSCRARSRHWPAVLVSPLTGGEPCRQDVPGERRSVSGHAQGPTPCGRGACSRWCMPCNPDMTYAVPPSSKPQSTSCQGPIRYRSSDRSSSSAPGA